MKNSFHHNGEVHNLTQISDGFVSIIQGKYGFYDRVKKEAPAVFRHWANKGFIPCTPKKLTGLQLLFTYRGVKVIVHETYEWEKGKPVYTASCYDNGHKISDGFRVEDTCIAACKLLDNLDLDFIKSQVSVANDCLKGIQIQAYELISIL